MKTGTAIALLTLAFSAICAYSQTGPTIKDLVLQKGVASHAGIDMIYSRFSQGYRDLNAVAVANLYTVSAIYLSPRSEIKKGRQRILEDFSGFFRSTRSDKKTLSITFRILERKISGDMGYDVGICTLVSTSLTGETRLSRGKFIVIALRSKDGMWRFQLDSYSDLPNGQ